VTKKIDNLKEGIGTALLPTLDRLGNMLIAALDDPRVQAAIENLTQWLSVTAPTALEMLMRLFDNLKGKGFVELTQMFEDGVKNIDWAAMSQNIMDWIIGIDWQQLGRSAAAGLGNIGEVVATVIQSVDWLALYGTIAKSLLDVIIGIGVQIAQAWIPAITQMVITIQLIKGIVMAKFEEIRVMIVNKIQGWINAFTSKVSAFADAGRAIVDAIKNGFLSAWDAVVTLISSMVDTLVSTITAPLTNLLPKSTTPATPQGQGLPAQGVSTSYSNAPQYNYGATYNIFDTTGLKGFG
jgi:hypothetical protein